MARQTTLYPDSAGLGQLIKLRRELAGWSQEELAERAQTNRVTITKIESGKFPFPKMTIARIAHALSLTLAEVAQASGRSVNELVSAPIYMRDPEPGITPAMSAPTPANASIHPTWNDAAYWAEIRSMVEAA